MTSKELQATINRCWTISDLEKRFRVTGMTIHNWRNNRGLPAVVIKSETRPAIRFVPDDVRAWATTNSVKMYGVA